MNANIDWYGGNDSLSRRGKLCLTVFVFGSLFIRKDAFKINIFMYCYVKKKFQITQITRMALKYKDI